MRLEWGGHKQPAGAGRVPVWLVVPSIVLELRRATVACMCGSGGSQTWFQRQLVVAPGQGRLGGWQVDLFDVQHLTKTSLDRGLPMST